MAESFFPQLLAGALAGITLLFLALAKVFTLGRSIGVKITACMLAGVLPTLGALQIFDESKLMVSVCVIVVSISLLLPYLCKVFVFQTLQKTPIHAGMLFILGIACMGVSTLRYNAAVLADDAQVQRDLAELESFVPQGDPQLDLVKTDKGRVVAVKRPTNDQDIQIASRAEAKVLAQYLAKAEVMRTALADYQSNCHGWVFTGGQYWLGGLQVQKILEDNSYIPTNKPQPGDIVVYREGDEVKHTAIVRITEDNRPVIVESKWGSLGVFIHPVGRCPYGEQFSFYHTERKGNLLARAYTHPDIANPAKHLNP